MRNFLDYFSTDPRSFYTDMDKIFDVYFEYPGLIEKWLVVAVCQSENDDSLTRLFIEIQNFHMLYPIVKYDLNINESNIRRVINIIRKNKWEQEEWDENNIYAEDFKEICRTPIYIPFICPELLSGEYVVFLLHPDLPETAKELCINY